MYPTPRVTLGIATYNRDTFLAEAIESCLAQEYESLEVLVVLDGSTNPRIDEIVSRYGSDPRFRSVRHDRNLGIAAAYDTFVSAGHGELIAMLGDDDVCLPDRVRRQVEIFDRHPDTGVVHGDATVIDGRGRILGDWKSSEFPPGELVRCFYGRHNYLIDPTRMVHRRVYQSVGGYDGSYRIAQDFEFWLRAARRFRFRHCGGGPLVKVRRHGSNESDESQRDLEAADVARALESALPLYPLRELVPNLDWQVLDTADAERQALLALADIVEQRAVPTPALARKLRDRANRLRPPQHRPRNGRRLMMTMFGWNDSGGGTILPRLLAKELVRRDWDVTVFHAATARLPGEPPYVQREWTEDGVRLIGIHNRPSDLFDIGHPSRELNDPTITAAFASALDRLRPNLVHFHNLHNLGAALLSEPSARGLPSFFTTHNYWLICPRAYLLTGAMEICPGPGDGSRCASCIGSRDAVAHRRRLADIRSRAHAGLTSILAVSDAVKAAFTAVGYDPGLLRVLRQATPHEAEIWARVGRDRPPGRRGQRLRVAFLGSAYPHKGPELLVQAAQRARAELDIRIIGEIRADFKARLQAEDKRGAVEFDGAFSPAEIGARLADVDIAVLPSLWWDCAPLTAAECHAARLPLVVPRLGGLAEAVRDGVDGLMFDGLDATSLAQQLDRLALEDGLLEAMQEAIQPPRAFSTYVDELEAHYEHALLDAQPSTESHQPSGAAKAVRWQGDHGLLTSLSIINDRVCERLVPPLQRVAADGRPLDPPLPHPASVEVHHQWPPNLSRPPAGALAAIVPWEFGSVPKDWVTDINANVDELWVPSTHVRQMYVDGGVPAERVVVIPNGVDINTFHPAHVHPDKPQRSRHAVRFLYVGGITMRKGWDVLLDAWDMAFDGRDDVMLSIKAAIAHGAYGTLNERLRTRSQADRLPRVELIAEDFDTARLAALYRSSDVFVAPYRGEGFAMPVLEAMASGLPVITTAGGPTDEFCPPEAGWRIRARRKPMGGDHVDHLETVGTPWLLEPDRAHLVELMRTAAAAPDERRARGRAARAAAEELSWDTVAALYAGRINVLAQQRPKLAKVPDDPFPLTDDVSLRVLATPAWKGHDRLSELLHIWASTTTPQDDACLYLLADPASAGSPPEVEARVTAAAAAANVDTDSCADINILFEPFRHDRDQRLHMAMDAYVPLHAGCTGQTRLAEITGNPIVPLNRRALTQLLDVVHQAGATP